MNFSTNTTHRTISAQTKLYTRMFTRHLNSGYKMWLLTKQTWVQGYKMNCIGNTRQMLIIVGKPEQVVHSWRAWNNVWTSDIF